MINFFLQMKEDDVSDVESRLLSGNDECANDGPTSPTLASAMQKSRSFDGDQFGTLRFRCEYARERGELLVTLIDACDLPPMDPNGKADPYIVVTVRPPSRGGEPRQYRTAVRHNCLNPTFNETAKLKLLPDELQGESSLSDFVTRTPDINDLFRGPVQTEILC